MLSILTTFGRVSGHDFSPAVKAQTRLGFESLRENHRSEH